MIDAYFVFTHSLWIVGASIALGTCSYHDWLRRELSRSIRRQLGDPSFRLPLFLGFLLVAVAFVLFESSRWWERTMWLLIGSAFARRGWGAASDLKTASGRPR